MPPFLFADLFCGIGSFHIALERLGGVCGIACDIDSNARKIYRSKFLCENPVHGDICTLSPKSLEGIDIVTAGFPCQPFSQAGKGKGFDDESRGNMFLEICRLLNYQKDDDNLLPTLILENVANLVKHDDGKTFEIICTKLKELGYKRITFSILKCSDFGIPQMRKRIFIVATCDEAFPDLETAIKPFKKPSMPLSEFLKCPNELESIVAKTIRCGGVGSYANDRHCWDAYFLKGKATSMKKQKEKPERPDPSTVYRLKIEDMLQLQGFPNTFFNDIDASMSSKLKMLGNTIPTVMTMAVCSAVVTRMCEVGTLSEE
jgi:DNA (cytosine-5)-methyltransferase 1